MQRIFKYEIPLADRFSLDMPGGAEVLSLQTQNGIPMLWAKVDPHAREERRYFEMRGTGHEVGEVGDFVGTIQLRGGALVFHIFEARG